MDAIETRSPQRLPNTWEVPQELRERFGAKAGRQRAHDFEGHVVLLLHRVPEQGATRRNAVYFWRHKLGEWSCSEGRHGHETLVEHVSKYEDAVEALESRVALAINTEGWFDILATAAPLHRAGVNMADALQAAQQSLPDGARHELQDAADAASEVARDTEMLQQQAQHSIDFLLARQNEMQALASEAQVDAAHRLNVVAAIFLPLATIASVFGMNLPNGMERTTVMMFWTIVIVGLMMGIGVGAKIMRLKSWKPLEW